MNSEWDPQLNRNVSVWLINLHRSIDSILQSLQLYNSRILSIVAPYASWYAYSCVSYCASRLSRTFCLLNRLLFCVELCVGLLIWALGCEWLSSSCYLHYSEAAACHALVSCFYFGPADANDFDSAAWFYICTSATFFAYPLYFNDQEHYGARNVLIAALELSRGPSWSLLL